MIFVQFAVIRYSPTTEVEVAVVVIAKISFIDEILSRCSCVSDNTNFIQNTDMENVLKKSQCILKVKVNYHSSSRNFADSFYFKRYDCTVLEMLKGDCFSDSEHVTIVLPTYDVKFSEQRFENQTIIVAVQKDKVFGDLEISSRNSIYSVSDYDEITRIRHDKIWQKVAMKS